MGWCSKQQLLPERSFLDGVCRNSPSSFRCLGLSPQNPRQPHLSESPGPCLLQEGSWGRSKSKNPVWPFLSWHVCRYGDSPCACRREFHRGGPTGCCKWHTLAGEPPTLVRMALCLTQPTWSGPASDLSQFKPFQRPDGCCQRLRHWQRSCGPWRTGGAVPCSVGPFPWEAASHSPEPYPEPEALPVGKQGGD